MASSRSPLANAALWFAFNGLVLLFFLIAVKSTSRKGSFFTLLGLVAAAIMPDSRLVIGAVEKLAMALPASSLIEVASGFLLTLTLYLFVLL